MGNEFGRQVKDPRTLPFGAANVDRTPGAVTNNQNSLVEMEIPWAQCTGLAQADPGLGQNPVKRLMWLARGIDDPTCFLQSEMSNFRLDPLRQCHSLEPIPVGEVPGYGRRMHQAEGRE